MGSLIFLSVWHLGWANKRPYPSSGFFKLPLELMSLSLVHSSLFKPGTELSNNDDDDIIIVREQLTYIAGHCAYTFHMLVLT